MGDDRRALIVHGHFYQPPRENPWSGAIDPEPTALPFPNWNERIYAECYRRNAFARVLDEFGRIEAIVNNYRLMSFNFGPTLFSWLEERHPRTYAAILNADRESADARSGHGNAIGQGYNHAILPLCNERDLRTQIHWGIEDFKHRFSREPKALWLPETAVNTAVMDALMDAGLKFVILSPTQAERVKPPGEAEWYDVADGSIDTGRAYLYLRSSDPDDSMAVFFYDDALARAVAFEGALTSSSGLIDRFERAIQGKAMISVATDGETYGHHHRFGEMGLAHALTVDAERRGFRLTNFAQYLEEHPPEWEVELKPGPGGEGTSWSCAHGVGRWVRDCGCSTHGQEGWNQEWRGPLRAALDLLRDHSAARFEERAGELFDDPWSVRDAYIESILNRHKGAEVFLRRFSKRPLRRREMIRARTLLEMQHHAMLMYTSCGWFFADISGLESTQVLKYAGRVLDFMDELELKSPRDGFLEVLAEAKSNIPQFGNGADVFRKFVEPARVSPRGLTAHLALSDLMMEGDEAGETAGYKFRKSLVRKEQHGRLTVATGRTILETIATGRVSDSAFAAIHFGGVDFYCLVKDFPGPRRFEKSAEILWEHFRTASLPVILRVCQKEFGHDEYSLDHILPEGRRRISEAVFGDLVRRISSQYTELYEENQRVIEMLHLAGFELPPELKSAAEYTLGRRFEEEILAQDRSLDPEAYERAAEIAEEVSRRGYKIDRTSANGIFGEMITEAVRLAISDNTKESLDSALTLVALAKRLGLDPEVDRAQEAIFEALKTRGRLPESLRIIALSVGLSASLLDGAGRAAVPA
jgi:alpha-amylase/alpha-mannosidase (GH57 family)